MLKKIAYIVVAGGLVFAAQAASADDTQFDAGGGRYQGVAALPFKPAPSGALASSEGMTPTAAAPQGLDRTHAGAVAPYNVPSGYFN